MPVQSSELTLMLAKSNILKSKELEKIEEKSKIIVDLSNSISSNQRQIKHLPKPPINDKTLTVSPR
jgi:hypothetical protein